MTGCIECGAPTPNRTCRACRLAERAAEAAAQDTGVYDCPTCDGLSSSESVPCYKCRSEGREIATDGGKNITPIAAETVVFNPKADGPDYDLRCPECEAKIEGVAGNGAEYRCDCDELHRFRIRGSDIDDEEIATDGGEAHPILYHAVRVGCPTRTVEVQAAGDGTNTIEKGTLTAELTVTEDLETTIEDDGWIAHYVAPDGGVGFNGISVPYDLVEIIPLPEPIPEEEAWDYVDDEWLRQIDEMVDGECSTSDAEWWACPDCGESTTIEENVRSCENCEWSYEIPMIGDDLDRGTGVETDGGRRPPDVTLTARPDSDLELVLAVRSEGELVEVAGAEGGKIGLYRARIDEDDLVADGGERDGEWYETVWTLTCLDCDFSDELTRKGHPRDGPHEDVEKRVTQHKHTTDESHVVRVEGRRADRDDEIDPSLLTDGGTPRYKIAERVASAVRDTAERELQRRAGNRLSEEEIEDLANWIEQQTEIDVNGTLKVQAAEEHDHDIAPDGGLPDSLEEFADPRTDDDFPCRGCGDEVPRKFLVDGHCIGCREGGDGPGASAHIAGDGDLITDGGCRYTRPTGPGYEGTYVVGVSATEVNLVSVGLERGTRVVSVAEHQNGQPAVRIQNPERVDADAEVLHRAAVNGDGYYTVSKAARVHLDVAHGDHVRLYTDDDAWVVVAAAADPFVEAGDRLATDGGRDAEELIEAGHGDYCDACGEFVFDWKECDCNGEGHRQDRLDRFATDGGAPLTHTKPTDRRDRANSHFCEAIGSRRYCLKQDCDLCADDGDVDDLLTDGGTAEPTRLMIDIETLGLAPGAAIVSIGAVHFHPDGLGDEFGASIDLQSCQAAGLDVDADTLQWWLKQDDGVRAQLRGGKPLGSTLAAFDRFYDDINPDEIWANSPAFDCAILEAAYDAVEGEAPWDFYERRDLRTLRNLGIKGGAEREGSEHDALADARYQAREAAALLREVQR